ncbi:MAG: phage portal protein [gamma proteobacterium symbiont of Taylorina sp.]|nr:phage portal protein [gamma proteobacterium symbiont of Taylorina sp.]
MNIIDAVAHAISPKWALNREVDRTRLNNYYEATKGTHLRKRRTFGESTADGEVNPSLVEMRELSRELDRNHDMARGVLTTLVTRIVGAQILPQPQIRDIEGNLLVNVNRDILKKFKKFAYRPEVTKTMSWGKAARLSCRTWLRDGEVLTKDIIGDVRGYNHSTSIPYSFELIEPDFLPVDYDDEKQNIKAGIKFNIWGEPKKYCLLKSLNSINFIVGRYSSSDVRMVPASQITHLAMKDRIHQTRGMSIFASVYTRLDDIKDYEESERIAARVAAAMTSFIKRNPEVYTSGKGASTETRHYEMQPGIIYDDLLPGEEPVSMQSNRPSGLLGDFRNAMLKMVSAGTNAGYSTISKNYDGTYSAQRQELVEQKGVYDILIEEFNSGWTMPRWINIIRAILLSGYQLPPETDMETIFDVHFQNPPVPWIDPKKEADGNRELNKLKVKTRSKIIRELGENPDDVMDEILKEDEKMGAADGEQTMELDDEEKE